MTTPHLKYINCLNPSGTHKTAYFQWDTPNTTSPIICVHGLTRNAHDFDKLAQALSHRTQVICPDVVGRGQSDWLPSPQLYDYSQYVSDMNTLITQTKSPKISWVGTSMGGLIGMMLAAMPQSPIKYLIINDVGPYLEAKALDRIASYTGTAPKFKNLQEVEQYLRTVHAPFAPMTNQDWQAMARHGSKQTANGNYQLSYDPKIGDALRASLTGQDINLWPIWEAISCPTLVIRGAKSDLLSQETAQQMTKTGPKAQLIEIAQAGHAPSLMSQDQINLIANWLKDHKML